MRKIWKIKPVLEHDAAELARQADIPPLIARLLMRRGFSTPAQAVDFLCADLSSLAPPEQMAEFTEAAELVRGAIAGKRKILIVGDYDVDGLTSSAVLCRGLRSLGGRVDVHIPHRMTDGYGLKEELIRRAAAQEVKLLLCTDCGTTSFKELRYAHKMGMETVVVDHHELLPAGRPPASAFLNPLQPACRYPEKELASVGVAFTLLRGLMKDQPSRLIWEHLDLVALGTIADVAPLTGENRILVKAGLHRLGGTDKPGLKALLASAKVERRPVTTEEVAFYLAPRLNAVGRTGSAEAALQLLVTDSPAEAGELAAKIEKENKARGSLERQAFAKALAKVEREVHFSRERIVILEDEEWHPGVIGIIASRLSSRLRRPVVVIARNGRFCRGSARSVGGFSLVETLEEIKEHLIEFGGHPAAAGFTVEADRIPLFRKSLQEAAHRRLHPDHLVHWIEADEKVELSSLSAELMRDLELLAPFGAGNPRPVFLSEDAQVPAERSPLPFHPWGIRFLVEDAQGRPFEAVQSRFDAAEGWNVRRLNPGPVALAYSPIVRRDQDDFRIELKLCDLKVPV
ncbi:MAG: single-stranded-DNA-specific exonuclease RecJ [Candidatus Omnitrophica bacterium]|nr:single-stranded-DNA-specific exonuclease RecJ [Candidatus Omnitrophota bacterium]